MFIINCFSLANGFFCSTDYYPEVPMLEEPQPRPDSSVNDWIKKPSPRVGQKSQEEPRKVENEYDMDCNEEISPNNVSRRIFFALRLREECSVFRILKI